MCLLTRSITHDLSLLKIIDDGTAVGPGLLWLLLPRAFVCLSGITTFAPLCGWDVPSPLPSITLILTAITTDWFPETCTIQFRICHYFPNTGPRRVFNPWTCILHVINLSASSPLRSISQAVLSFMENILPYSFSRYLCQNSIMILSYE